MPKENVGFDHKRNHTINKLSSHEPVKIQRSANIPAMVHQNDSSAQVNKIAHKVAH